MKVEAGDDGFRRRTFRSAGDDARGRFAVRGR